MRAYFVFFFVWDIVANAASTGIFRELKPDVGVESFHLLVDDLQIGQPTIMPSQAIRFVTEATWPV